jgi:hypothetical protein
MVIASRAMDCDRRVSSRRLPVLVAALAAAALLIAPGAASATVTQSAHSGAVSATFTFAGKYPNYTGEHLEITRDGTLAYNQPVSSPSCKPCAPGAPEKGFSSVRVLDVESDGEPDVLLDLFTGGAHCCSLTQIFRYDPTSATYVEAEHNWGDPSYKLVDLGHDGHSEFQTADDSFAYEFTDYAFSGLPIEILTFSAGKFTNVTRQYPALIRKDAARWLKAFKHNIRDGVGLIAPWAADEDLLGHEALVQHTLNKEAQQGNLRSALSPEEPGGKKFVRNLQRFLRKHGYTQ